MSLAPLPHTKLYSSIDELMQAVNTCTKSQGYAITKRCTKSGKNGINSAIFCCNRGQQHQEQIPLEFKQAVRVAVKLAEDLPITRSFRRP